jgi:hypothetical protein
MRATVDRGEIIHAAGRSRLSPAVRDGTPFLVGHGDVSGRCGWEPFFRALSARHLAVAFDPEAPGDVRLVPRADAEPHRGHGPRPLEEARRFLAALRGKPPAG